MRLLAHSLLVIASSTSAIRAQGQTVQRTLRFGVSAGLTFQPDTRDDYQKRLGQVVAGELQWRFSRRIGVSTQVLAARFGADEAHITVTYPPNSGTDPGLYDPPFARPHSLASVSANLILFDDDAARTGRGAHYQVGVAMFRPIYAVDHLYVSRLGWRAGIGYDIRIRGVPSTIDISVHQVDRWPEKSWLMIPLMLGVSW